MKNVESVMDWNTGKVIEIFEENDKLYVSDNFGIASKEIDMDRWLSIYEIFNGKDKIYELVESSKKTKEWRDKNKKIIEG